MIAIHSRKIRKYKYHIQEIIPLSLAAEAVAGTNMTVFNIIKIDRDSTNWSHIGDSPRFFKCYADAFEEATRLIKEEDGRKNSDMVKNIWEVT